MKRYDFTAYTAPLTQTDFDAVPKNARTKPFSVIGVTLIGGVIVGAIFLTGPIFGLLLVNGSDVSLLIASLFSKLFTVGIITAGIAGLAVLVNKGIASNTNRLARMYKFANANGLSYAYGIEPAGLNGLIFDEGHSRKVTELLSFPEGFEIGNYKYVTGSGKNRQTHTFGFVRVALSQSLPNMVLDAKSNNFMNFSNLPDVFQSSQRFELEGNFNQYFDLYVPQQYERDALYVFTPDVMQALINSGRKLDMEIVDNELFIYQPYGIDLASQSKLETLLVSVDAISNELKNQTKRYSDERVPVAEGSAPIVADQGKRLKQSFNWSIIAIVVAFFGFQSASAFLPNELLLPLLSIGGIVFWGIVLFVVVKTIRRNTAG